MNICYLDNNLEEYLIIQRKQVSEYELKYIDMEDQKIREEDQGYNIITQIEEEINKLSKDKYKIKFNNLYDSNLIIDNNLLIIGYNALCVDINSFVKGVIYNLKKDKKRILS